jgi:putative sterol carrier protein/predicted SnoaL-like aldol condensation-catalyzing enzyme
MKANPEEVVRKYISAKDNHEWDRLIALLDPEFTSSDPSVPEPVKGIQAVSQYFPMLEQVPMKTKILTMMSKGEDVAAELAVTCTIQEDGAPRSFTVTFAKFYRVNSKGLLVDEREYSDTATKFKALGHDAAGAFGSFGGVETVTPETTEKEAENEKDEVVTTGLTPKAIFETRVAENLKSNLDKLVGVDAICQFNITGNSGGSWYVDMTVTPPMVIAGTNDKAKCTITCADKVIVGIMSGKINATLAFLTNKMKITGDIGLASVLRVILN